MNSDITRFSMHERQEIHIDALADDDGLWIYWHDHKMIVDELNSRMAGLTGLATYWRIPGVRQTMMRTAKPLADLIDTALARFTTTADGGEEQT